MGAQVGQGPQAGEGDREGQCLDDGSDSECVAEPVGRQGGDEETGERERGQEQHGGQRQRRAERLGGDEVGAQGAQTTLRPPSPAMNTATRTRYAP